MQVAAKQDRECFARLFMEFAPRVKAYLVHHGLSPEAAEDLAQETLANVWRKAVTFDPLKASAAAWIFTIARNLRVDALRKEPHPSHLAESFAPPPTEPRTPEEVYECRERERKIQEALSILSGEQLEVLRLSFFMGRPHADIAAELDLPLGTVKSRLRLAMAHLRMTIDRA